MTERQRHCPHCKQEGEMLGSRPLNMLDMVDTSDGPSHHCTFCRCPTCGKLWMVLQDDKDRWYASGDDKEQ